MKLIKYGDINLEAFEKNYKRTLETDRILRETTEQAMRLNPETLKRVIDF